MKQKGFFTKHAKSSAAMISLGIHAVVILLAVTFVAVTVVTKGDQKFEIKSVKRPKMQLKKLQVPVNIKKKKTQKPKLRKRIVVQPKLNQSMPDIKMPEITGVKGGVGNLSDGVGLGGGIGFSMPEVNVFGVRSKGEKLFFILDADANMMYDEMGGIEAYNLIKEELVRIVDGLSPTVIFNVAVFERGSRSKVLFPGMVSASQRNVELMKAWLEPLNHYEQGSGQAVYGVKTAGSDGASINEEFNIEPIKNYGFWINPAMLAMKQQADSIYLLTCQWGNLWHRIENVESKVSSDHVDELYRKAMAKLEKDNELRTKKGQPPRVLSGKASIIKAYYPEADLGGGHVNFSYTPEIMGDAFAEARQKYAPEIPLSKSGLSRKKKGGTPFSFNVIHFVRNDGNFHQPTIDNLKKMTSTCRGEYRSLAGLEAVHGYVSSDDPES